MNTADLETKIKSLISESVAAELLEGTPRISTKNICFGVVDLSRYEADVVCSILPEEQTVEEGKIDGIEIRSRFVITFLFRKSEYKNLMNYMTDYADAFRKAVVKDSDFNGSFDEVVLGSTKFYSDAGAVAQQMTATEIEIEVLNEETYI